MKQRICLSAGMVLIALVVLVVLAQATIPAERVEAQEGSANAALLGGAGVLHIAGASFVPESSSTVFVTSDAGDVAVTGSSDRYMHAPVLLPDGAQVSGLSFYYYDDHNPGSMTARLVRNNDPEIGSRDTLALASSPAGAVLYDSAYGATPPGLAEITNARYNYELEVEWSDGSSDLKLMSVKLFYTAP